MITQEQLKALLSYSPRTGLFMWRIVTGRRRNPAGTVAHNGYVVITIDGTKHGAHRLAWLYMTGLSPERIDHKDRDKINNKWKNLREATHGQNLVNSKLSIKSTTGFKGVSKHPLCDRYQAFVGSTYLGLYNTPEEAHEAYMRKARELYGDFAHDGG